jgi:uncharacterized membrane protein YbhN (UPF0104 family)
MASGWRDTLRRRWPLLKRILTVGFMVAVAALLLNYARNVEWGQVWEALRAYEAWVLVAAAALAALSFATYACYDLLGKRWAGHAVPAPRVMLVAFVSYVFNLNLGALVGGFAFRYRLYARSGLSAEVTTRVLTMSVVTNWLGYVALAGFLFGTRQVPAPPGWEMGQGALQLLGIAFVVLVIGYLALCAFSSRRSWTVRGHEIALPGIGLAAAQLLLSCLNWSLMGLLLFLLMPEGIGYFTVLGVLLLGGIAGAVTHIPAGLGVVEAVFVAILGGEHARHELLAALFCYRAIYYLAPLAVATAVYLLIEARGERGGASQELRAKSA